MWVMGVVGGKRKHVGERTERAVVGGHTESVVVAGHTESAAAGIRVGTPQVCVHTGREQGYWVGVLVV